MKLIIREEQERDFGEIYRLNNEAFGRSEEAELVNELRENDGIIISLVALLSNLIVGHILYTPCKINSHKNELTGAALGPMAVLPGYQKKGIGRKMVEESIEILSEAAYPFIAVLGYPEYYSQFGFTPAGKHGLRCQWDVPDEAFMILPLDSERTDEITGTVTYRPEFSKFANIVGE
ncbi:GNAT family N-acetyltransferase [Flexistipes sp.]|uniref:GNAT family N-acetyltransferase n=1 Tax=Flexistipes sp. TaxID=3088135 RepID=UPI002E1FC738|nr:N-acetyltransferase [Flexistipes sp.]